MNYRIKKDSPALPKLGIVGKIKVGELSERGFPTSLDYFKPYSKTLPIAVNAFKSVFGEKPQQIPITFANDDHKNNCYNLLELRSNTGDLVARGDGENFELSEKDGWKIITKQQIEDSNYKTVENFKAIKAEKLNKEKYKAEWKEVLYLRFMIPQVRILGCWELLTGGDETTIPQIISAYDTILDVRGTVTNQPFLLSVAKVKSNRALDFKRSYPVISLNPILTIDESTLNSNVLMLGTENKD